MFFILVVAVGVGGGEGVFLSRLRFIFGMFLDLGVPLVRVNTSFRIVLLHLLGDDMMSVLGLGLRYCNTLSQ